MFAILPTFAATITGSLKDQLGVAPTRLTVTLSAVPAEVTANDPDTQLPIKSAIVVSNGAFSASIVGGLHKLDFGSFAPALLILVPPNDTNTYDLNYVAALATNAPSFQWTNTLGRISTRIRPGSNITLTTNNPAQANEYLTLDAPPPGASDSPSVFYIDSNGTTNGAGTLADPISDITNAFKLIQNNTTVYIRGSFTVPTVEVIGGAPQPANLHLESVTNVTLQGEGRPILYFTGKGYACTLSNLCNFTLRDTVWIGDRSSDNGWPTNGLAAALGFAGTNEQVRIQNNCFSNWIDQCISMLEHPFSTHHAWIQNNDFYNVGNSNMVYIGAGAQDGSCISGFIGSDFWVEGNYASNIMRFFEFENAGQSASGQRHNIYVVNNALVEVCEYLAMFAPYAGVRAENVLVTGNLVSHGGTYGPAMTGAASIKFGGVTNALIAGNTILNSKGAGIALICENTNGVDRIVIRDNKIIGTNTADGVELKHTSGQAGFINTVDILDNYFEGCGGSSGGAVVRGGAAKLRIEGNVIERALLHNYNAVITLVNGGGLQGDYSRCTNAVIRRNILRSLYTNGDGRYFVWCAASGSVGISSVTIEDNELWPGYTTASECVLYGAGVATTNLFIRHRAGFGTPEGAITANIGSTWLNTAGGAGTTFYIKESGTGNTGWTGK